MLRTLLAIIRYSQAHVKACPSMKGAQPQETRGQYLVDNITFYSLGMKC
jgi:hypothetical protein